jgi:hypothetical protein
VEQSNDNALDQRGDADRGELAELVAFTELTNTQRPATAIPLSFIVVLLFFMVA